MATEPMTPATARAAIAGLRARCDEDNSSVGLRDHLDATLAAFDAGDLDRALGLVSTGAGHVADTANIARLRREHPEVLAGGEPALQADEAATDAHLILSDVRFRLGFKGMGVMPANVDIIRGRR